MAGERLIQKGRIVSTSIGDSIGSLVFGPVLEVI